MAMYESVHSWFTRHHTKIRDIGVGLTVWEFCNVITDFLWYPFAMVYWGTVAGGIIAFITISLINTLVFILYEYMKVDWLGAHALRQIDEKENKSALEKLITWIGRKKTTWWEKVMSPIIFIGLTLPIDPVIVAIHYRRQHFRGISWRDWGIFFAANFSANTWWFIKVGFVIEGVQWLIRLMTPIF